MILQRAYSPTPFRSEGHALVDRLADYLESVADQPANAIPDAGKLVEEYREMLDQGADAGAVFAKTISGSVHLHSPDYMGHQVVPPLPLSALGDLVGSLLNTGMAIYEMGAPGVAMERIVIERFAEMLELEDTAGGFLTHGGTLANLTALLCARAVRWPDGDPWVEGNGDVRPCVLVNAQAHYCIDRAVRIMGWGKAGLVPVPCDENFRLRTDLLEGALAGARQQGLTPIAVVGSACTTSTGSYDDLAGLADFAERHALWFHVDGAHGAPIRLDPDNRHRVDGLERADSITMDFHKMLMTPALTTGLFFRRSTDAYRTFHQEADYLMSFDSGEEDWENIGRRTFECTKYLQSLRVFLPLCVYGPGLFRDYVIRVGQLGKTLAGLVTAEADLELALQPDVNIVCFRFRPYGEGVSAGELNDLNTMVRAALVGEGRRYLVQTRLREAIWLRCTLTNPLTTENHLRDMLADIVARGRSLRNFKRSGPNFR